MSRIALSQSERLRIAMDQQPKFIHRGKVRDSSERTVYYQSQASQTEIPTKVAGAIIYEGKVFETAYKGKGTNMEYGAVLQKAQANSLASDVDPMQYPGITLAPAVYDNRKMPLSQQDLSGAFVQGVFTGPYTSPACKIPGFVQYFPAPIFNGSRCNFNQNVYPSG